MAPVPPTTKHYKLLQLDGLMRLGSLVRVEAVCANMEVTFTPPPLLLQVFSVEIVARVQSDSSKRAPITFATSGSTIYAQGLWSLRLTRAPK
jgi:hypothetical protein